MIITMLQTQYTYNYATESCTTVYELVCPTSKHSLNLLWHANTFKKITPAKTGSPCRIKYTEIM